MNDDIDIYRPTLHTLFLGIEMHLQHNAVMNETLLCFGLPSLLTSRASTQGRLLLSTCRQPWVGRAP